MIPVERPAEDMGKYRNKEAAYRILSEEMKGLRLSDEDMRRCIDDYGKLGAAVTDALMRRELRNYQEVVDEGAFASQDHDKYFMRFRAVMPFRIYSTIWALEQSEMNNAPGKDARERAEKHFNNLNDPVFVMETYFPV
jgi:hypothetical protein